MIDSGCLAGKEKGRRVVLKAAPVLCKAADIKGVLSVEPCCSPGREGSPYAAIMGLIPL